MEEPDNHVKTTDEIIRDSELLRAELESRLLEIARNEQEIRNKPPEYHKTKLLRMYEKDRQWTLKSIEKLKRGEEQLHQLKKKKEEQKIKWEARERKWEEQQAKRDEQRAKREAYWAKWEEQQAKRAEKQAGKK